MAGLLNGVFGKNDAYKWFDQNRNGVGQAFAGLIGAKDFGQGAQGVAYGALNGNQADLVRNETAQKKQDEMTQRQQAADIIRNQYNRPEVADALIQGGLGLSDAWNNVLTGMQGPELTANQRDFQYAQQNPEYANFLNPPAQQKPPEAPTLTSIYDENGREQKGYMTPEGFKPVGSPKANTERPEFNASEATAAGYADRMFLANQVLNDPKLASIQTDVGQKMQAATPLIGNFLTSKEYQQADQAQRDFINALLRRESGAVISDSEFANASKQYFPQPGDSAEAIQQKIYNRQTAINGVVRASGPAYALPNLNGSLDPQQEKKPLGALEPNGTYVWNPQTGQLEKAMITVKLPNGATVQFPDNTSGDTITAALSQQFGGAQKTGYQQATDNSSNISQNFFTLDPRAKTPVNLATSTEATLAGLVNGIPILGPLAQNATDNLMGLGAQLTGGDYGKTVQGLKDRRQALAEDLPIASIAGNIGGAVVPYGAAMKAGTLATDALGLTGPTLKQAVNSGLSTLGIGSVDNIVRGQKPTDAVQNSILNAGLSAGAPLVGKGVEIATNAIGRKVQPIVGAVLDPAMEALRRGGMAVQRDKGANAGLLLNPVDEAAAKLNNVPLVNADRGGETVRALTRSIANQSPEARGAIERLTTDRFAGQGGRAVDFIKRITGGAVDDLGYQQSIKEVAQAVNKPAYEKAFSSPQASAVWNQPIRELMQSEAFRSAINAAEKRGTDKAAISGFKAVKNPFDFRPNGTVTLKVNADGSRALPSLAFWDQVKRNLDGMIGTAQRSGDNALTADLTAIKSKLTNSLDAAVPTYATARKGAASFFGADDALDAGRKFASATNVVPEAKAAFAKFKPAEKDAFRVGYASELIGKAKSVGDRRNVITSLFDRAEKREVFETIFGPQKARELEAYIRVEEAADKLRGALGNSTTARQLVELGIGAGSGYAISGGDWKGALTGAALTKGARYLGTKADDKVMQELAELLLSNDPKALQMAVNQASLSPLWMEALKAIGNIGMSATKGSLLAGATSIPATMGATNASP